MAVVGFNPKMVDNVIKAVDKSYSAVGKTIGTIIQNKILNPMGEAWYAPEAVKYWKGEEGKGFDPALTKCEEKIKKAYEDYKQGLSKAVVHWAENTGYNAESKISVTEKQEIKVKYDCIKQQKEDGTIGIEGDKAKKVESSLKQTQNDIKSELGKLGSKLADIDKLFLGKSQAENARTCFKAVNEAVADLFSFFTEGGKDGKSLKQVIDAYIEKYGDIAKDVNKAFDTSKK